MSLEDFEEMPVTRQEVQEMIREAQQGPRIRKGRIKECVDRMFEERIVLTAHTLAEISAECALAALGCIIVDDSLQEETRFGGYGKPWESRGPVDTAKESVAHSVNEKAGCTRANMMDIQDELGKAINPSTSEQARRLRTLHEARELIDTLIQEAAGIREPSPPEWRPIQTAPKDGSVILACGGDFLKAHTVIWRHGRWNFSWDWSDMPGDFEWWMPIPGLKTESNQ